MRRTLRHLAVVPVVIAAVVTALLLGAPASAALPPAVASWRVTVSGTVSGSPFTVGGTVTLHRTVTRAGTANGLNAGDVCLKAGFPAGLPATGAIWYGTNSACFGVARANVDLAYVTVTSNQITAKPDGRLRALMANTWMKRSAATTCPYSPAGGTAVYRVDDNGSLSGTLRLQGQGGAYCGPSGYHATVTGVRIS
ncbi:hypothetical protein [Actinoplanes xinjiangensis]|uniref:hypothetical protein n=1 Tax=Actinoplanes xinjiangensis TaxID=512350 RepID=UPI00341FADE5